MPSIQNLFLVPIYVGYCLIYLWILMGWISVLAGCFVMGLCMYTAARASKQLKFLQANKSKDADVRMEAMGEAIGGVQVRDQRERDIIYSIFRNGVGALCKIYSRGGMNTHTPAPA